MPKGFGNLGLSKSFLKRIGASGYPTTNPGGTPDADTCLVTVSAASIAYGAGTLTITLTAYDAGNARITTGGATVTFGKGSGTSDGTISAVTDVGDGTYTATWTPSTAGTARTISATVGGDTVIDTASITTLPGTIDRTTSTVTTYGSQDWESVGYGLVVTLQAKDGAGNSLTSGGSTVVFENSGGVSDGTWSATTDNSNGTYSATFTATTAGTATTVTCTIGGQAVTTTMPTITVVDEGEPVYDSGTQTLLLSDNFDSYSTFDDTLAGGWRSATPYSDAPPTYAGTLQDTVSDAAGSNLVTTGRTGSGKALRLRYYGVYTSGVEEGHFWRNETGWGTVAGKASNPCYAQYWMRLTTNTPGSSLASRTAKVKFFQLWLSPSGTLQINTDWGHRAPATQPDTVFAIYPGNLGAADTSTKHGEQLGPPWIEDYEGEWVRLTVKWAAESTAGARDGVATMWLNGLRLVSMDPTLIDVDVPDPVAGAANNYWCVNDDMDAFPDGNYYVYKIHFGGTQTRSGGAINDVWAFDIDIDDFRVWRD